MIDFTKKVPAASRSKQTDPVLLYDDLDRKATAGPLRPVQNEVLTEWYNNRFEDKDIIVKLHTGEGKTLIGLLMLQSRLNAGKGPALFVCPNKQLAEQTANDAIKFGVPYILDQGGTNIPEDVLESKKIWITYIQRVFNGRTIFGLDNHGVHIGTMVIDDSHACIDSIRNATSIRIPRSKELFRALLTMFESSLRQQGEGTFLNILLDDYSSEVITIPYWEWINRTTEIAGLFYEYSEDECVRFVYPILKDIIKDCTVYATSQGIEVVPDYSLIYRFQFFVNCQQRIFMSATTQDDSFFIKGFGLSEVAIKNPLVNSTKKWSGEKMILFPTRVDESITVDYVRKYLGYLGAQNIAKSVALVPSARIGELYTKQEYPAVLANRDIMNQELQYLQNRTSAPPHAVVFFNRYDGIDLPDDQCRILLIDSKPVFGNLSDRYEQSCRQESDIVATKVAQKIEQGLGRSVRGEKDYSVIMMIGEDLVRFVKSTPNQRFFSAQTRQQIQIAEDVLKMVIDESHKKDINVVHELIMQCLKRDPGWKDYYHQAMDKTEENVEAHPYLPIIVLEEEAESLMRREQYEEAFDKYQSIANMFNDKPMEKGWYLQKAAKCKYLYDKINGEKLQEIAHDLNWYLLKPEGVHYRPIPKINQNSLSLALTYIRKHNKHDDLSLHVDEILANLSFGVPANKFENALKEIGELLGYTSQRPDKEFKVGPDNLWMEPIGRQFFAIECKNEVLTTRDTINKEEVGQMNNHIAWFEENYKGEMQVSYIHVHATNKVSNQANYTKEVRIMTPEKLSVFREHIKKFVKELCNYKIASLDEGLIAEALRVNRLMPMDIIPCYTVKAVK